MGKRELLLVAGFLILGVVVHQATAPPAGPGESGLSLSRLLNSVRREMRGNPASAERTIVSIHPIDDEVSELRVSEHVREVHISGEDRADVEASLRVVSNAYDEAEASQTLDQTVLRTDHAASSLLMRIEYPRAGRQRATLTLKVPARLHVRVESRPDTLAIRGVASVEAPNAAGETTVSRVAGRVAVNHQSGAATIEDVSSLRFTGRNSRLALRGVREETAVVMEQGGTLTASELEGRIEIQSRNADVALRGAAAAGGTLRVNANGGSVVLDDLRTETRVDGRNTKLTVTMVGAASLDIHSQGGTVTLTPPAAGHHLDLLVREGRIEVPPGGTPGVEPTTDDSGKESRLSAAADGGGPPITVRHRGGDIVLRARPAE